MANFPARFRQAGSRSSGGNANGLDRPRVFIVAQRGRAARSERGFPPPKGLRRRKAMQAQPILAPATLAPSRVQPTTGNRIGLSDAHRRSPPIRLAAVRRRQARASAPARRSRRLIHHVTAFMTSVSLKAANPLISARLAAQLSCPPRRRSADCPCPGPRRQEVADIAAGSVTSRLRPGIQGI